MEIKVAKNAGFCFGVRNAVDCAFSHAGEDVSVLGELIHNASVTEKLNLAGIKTFAKKEDVCTSSVIIRSHGESKKTFDYFNAKGIKIYDATCPFVNRIHEIVKNARAEGKSVIILGRKDHAEVVGINGWCENDALIFEDEFDLDLLEKGKKYVLVEQTTYSFEKFSKIKQNIQKQCDKTVEIFETICYTTKERQREAEELSKNSDVVLVLGDKKSSNTAKLFEIASRFSKHVYFIDKISELDSVFIKKFDRLAIIAGASTPDELIEEVRNTMSEEITSKSTEEVKESVANVAEVKAAPVEKELTMEDVMKSSDSLMGNVHAGKRIKTVVISADNTGIKVELPRFKVDGLIPKDEVSIDGSYNPDDYKRGDEIDAIVIENNTKDHTCIWLSKKEVDIISEGDKEAEKALQSAEFSMTCDKVVKGGLIGRLGSYTVFVPASQIRTSFVKNLDEYVGKTLRLRALPPKEEEGRKPNPKRIVASQRVILEEEKTAREDAFWSEMVEGAVVNGKVKRFTDFGAFVSVKGFDCLARNVDLAWYRIEKPSDVLELNAKYDFVVLHADREANKIALGYKQLQPTPYEAAAEKYAVGDIINGTVVRISPFGAFVSIEPGVDGLVHISQVAHQFLKNIEEVLKVGDPVTAKIIKFENNRITLSIKETLPEPEVVETPAENAEGAEGETEKKPTRRNRRFDAESSEEAKKFRENKKEKKERKKEDDGEPHEWHSDDSAATIGDLLKGLDLDGKFDK